MIANLILAIALGGCPNGQCTVQKTVIRERTVVVNRVVEAAPVRKVVKSVHVQRVRVLRRLFR